MSSSSLNKRTRTTVKQAENMSSSSSNKRTRPTAKHIELQNEKLPFTKTPSSSNHVPPKAIAFYNHKGGVGKTSNAFQVAYGLALREKKVLIVDLDHQMTMTYNFVRGDFRHPDPNKPFDAVSTDWWQQFNRNDESNRNIYQTIKELPNAEVTDVAVRKHHQLSNLKIIIGSERVSEVDFDITRGAALLMSGMSAAAHDVAKPWMLMDRLKKLDLDYIIVDLPPSYNTFSRTFLATCDFWILSAMADEFSTQAMRSIVGKIRKPKLSWTDGESHHFIDNEIHSIIMKMKGLGVQSTYEASLIKYPHFKVLGVMVNRLRFRNREQNAMTQLQEDSIMRMVKIFRSARRNWKLAHNWTPFLEEGETEEEDNGGDDDSDDDDSNDDDPDDDEDTVTVEDLKLVAAKLSDFASTNSPSQMLSIPSPYLTHQQCIPFRPGYSDLSQSFPVWRSEIETLLDRLVKL